MGIVRFDNGRTLTLAVLCLLFSIGWISTSCMPIAAPAEKDGKDQAITLVQNFGLSTGPNETIQARIDRVIDLSKKAGMKEEVVGWSASELDESRYNVFFSLRENDKWIGFEWFVNLNNGWVNPTNQYSSWLMVDKQW